MRSLTLTVLAITVLLGCSQLDMRISSDGPAWGESYDRDQDATDHERRTERLAQVLATWNERAGSGPADYLIGRGDVLEVGIVSLASPGVLTTMRRTVLHGGDISLPLVASVSVAGLGERLAQERIAAAYADRYIRRPQVTVSVAEHRSVAVVVTGAVNKPGIYPLTTNSSTVLESLALAGGPSLAAGDEVLLIRSKRNEQDTRRDVDNKSQGDSAGTGKNATATAAREVISIDLKELIDEGNLLLNAVVTAGDIITVPSRATEYVYVLGYVRRPGAYKLEGGARVDAIRALALGGGLSGMARPKRSFLIRQTRYGQQTIPVDLTRIASGDLPPLYLRGGDMLVVCTNIWGKVSEIIRPGAVATVSANASVAP